MDKAVIYIHGKGGNAEEAIHYKPLFSNCDVIGLDYTAQFPWEAKEEFPLLFNSIYRNYKTVEVIANSIGAYFAINALSNQQIEKAYFISPVVDMERLIADMMIWANVTEDELKEKKEIQTTFGETLSWDYLCYARENPIIWEIPTHILYGEKDNLTAYGTIFEFVQRTNSTLSIMKNGEHWFHTKEQMQFLDNWIKNRRPCNETENKDGFASPAYGSGNRAGADGSKVKEKRFRYSCHYNVRHPGQCDGQSGYGVTKLDAIVESIVCTKFSEILECSKSKLLQDMLRKDMEVAQKEVSRAKSELDLKENACTFYIWHQVYRLTRVRIHDKLYIVSCGLKGDSTMSVKYTTPAQHKSNLRNVYGTFAIEGMTISKDTRSNLDRIGSGQASYQQVVNELRAKYAKKG